MLVSVEAEEEHPREATPGTKAGFEWHGWFLDRTAIVHSQSLESVDIILCQMSSQAC